MKWSSPAAAAVLAAVLATPTAAELPETVATFRGGSVTRDELASWRQLVDGEASTAADGLRRDVEAVVLLRALEEVARGQGLLTARSGIVARRQLERELATGALRGHLLESAQPTPAQVRARYEAERARYDKPKRFQLRGIFLRFPEDAEDAERQALRREMENLEARLEAGADFGRLAAEHSHSATRVRQGRMGYVTLDRLDPGVAAVVAKMKAGERGPVIETAAGLSLLECTRILPAGLRPFDQVRERIHNVLVSETRSQAMEHLRQRVRAETSLESREDGVLLHRAGDVVTEIRRDEYQHFLKSRGVAKAPGELPAARHRHWQGELLLELGLEREAQRLGLDRRPRFQDKLHWEHLRLAAHLVLTERVHQTVTPPSEKEIAEHYRAHLDGYTVPETFHLSSVEVRLGRDTPKALITRAQEVARGLREPTTEGLSWETAADVIDPTGTFVRRRELGWMKELDFFHLGAHPEEAAKGLAVGGTSELLQEGPKLMILRLDARREPRARPLAEVRDAIFRKLGNPRLAAAQRRIEAEILAAQEIVLTAEGGGS